MLRRHKYYSLAFTDTFAAFACRIAAASFTMLSTICFAGRTSWMSAATRPMSHARASSDFSGCSFRSCSYGRTPFAVSSLISAWRLLFLRATIRRMLRHEIRVWTYQSST